MCGMVGFRRRKRCERTPTGRSPTCCRKETVGSTSPSAAAPPGEGGTLDGGAPGAGSASSAAGGGAPCLRGAAATGGFGAPCRRGAAATVGEGRRRPAVTLPPPRRADGMLEEDPCRPLRPPSPLLSPPLTTTPWPLTPPALRDKPPRRSSRSVAADRECGTAAASPSSARLPPHKSPRPSPGKVPPRKSGLN